MKNMLLIKFNLYSIIIMGGFYMKKFLKKLKKFIIKNKVLSVLILLIILIFIFALVVIKIFVFPNYHTSKYGNRLDGIENVKIDDSRLDDIKNNFSSIEGFNFDGYRLSGKIINIYISITGDLSTDTIRDKCREIIKSFNEDEIKFYDFQFYVDGEGEKYPMMGYKNANSEDLDLK